MQDFFSAQDNVRRRTRLLVVLLTLSIIAIIILTNLSIMFFGYLNDGMAAGGFWRQFDWRRFWVVGAGVLTVVVSGSLIHGLTLRGGGSAVADTMKARLVSGNPKNFLERRLLNIVEEMAIAAGIPVPQVYVMDQEFGINAFAAGFTTGDAVVAVTQGALEKLRREELQGVIGHEVSHILNGDMRLNMRVMVALFGVLMVAQTGRVLKSWAEAEVVDINEAKRRSTGGNPLGIFPAVLSVGLLIVGYMGMFFANLIKAALSRQREYLADASAVQFTRSPLGIAGALKKIGGDEDGPELQNPMVEEISHACFESGVHYRFFDDWFATHPPLDERIRKLDPAWNGVFPAPERINQVDAELSERRRHQQNEQLTQVTQVATLFTLGAASQKIGADAQMQAERLQAASALIDSVPDYLRNASEEPFGARGLIYALVLSPKPEIRQKQMQWLQKQAELGVAMFAEQYVDALSGLPDNMRLVLVDMSMPALRQLSARQYQLFKTNLQQLIGSREQTGIFEWALQMIVIHGLDAHFEHKIGGRSRFGSFGAVRDELNLMLSFLVLNSHDSKMTALHAFKAANDELPDVELTLDTSAHLDFEQLERALQRLSQLTPLLKPKLLQACVASVAHDDKITATEMELLRAFSTLLGAPMPLLPDLPRLG